MTHLDNQRQSKLPQPNQGVWRTYDGSDGLPGAVWCLLQDQQGYLWLGTIAGFPRVTTWGVRLLDAQERGVWMISGEPTKAVFGPCAHPE